MPEPTNRDNASIAYLESNVDGHAKCLICAEAMGLDKRPLKPCEDCKAWYHEECWEYVGGCATYGCRAAPKAETSNTQLRKAEYQALLKSIADASIKSTRLEFGTSTPEMTTEVWKTWSTSVDAQGRLSQVRAIAQASGRDFRKAAMATVVEVAGQVSEDQRRTILQYLNQVPSRLRQSLRRPQDPKGCTIHSQYKLASPEDLQQILPERVSPFTVGCRPPGIGDWELVEMLGAGGIGEVWKAINPNLEHSPPVALKFCLDENAKKLLRHEAAILARVMQHGSHKGIVQLRHTYLSADPPCLEYEFVESGDLGSLIQEWHRARAKTNPIHAGTVVNQLTSIVAHFHKLTPPIVHRDLKPANILVEKLPGGKIRFKITDFGIGGIQSLSSIRSTQQASSQGRFLTSIMRGSHTPLYASPQQIRGDAPDPRDDVHALGVIWHQFLTGDLSVGAPSGRQWEKDLKKQGMTEAEIELLAACVEPKAEDRPRSAEELNARLADAISQAKTTSSAPTPKSQEGTSPIPVQSPSGAFRIDSLNLKEAFKDDQRPAPGSQNTNHQQTQDLTPTKPPQTEIEGAQGEEDSKTTAPGTLVGSTRTEVPCQDTTPSGKDHELLLDYHPWETFKPGTKPKSQPKVEVEETKTCPRCGKVFMPSQYPIHEEKCTGKADVEPSSSPSLSDKRRLTMCLLLTVSAWGAFVYLDQLRYENYLLERGFNMLFADRLVDKSLFSGLHLVVGVVLWGLYTWTTRLSSRPILGFEGAVMSVCLGFGVIQLLSPGDVIPYWVLLLLFWVVGPTIAFGPPDPKAAKNQESPSEHLGRLTDDPD